MLQQNQGESKEKLSQEQANEQSKSQRKGLGKKLFPPNRPSV